MDLKLTQRQKEQALACARGVADWLCNIQAAATGEYLPPVGHMPFIISPRGSETPAQNWNYAFACMGLLGAAKTFKEVRYERAAFNIARNMKALQILDPFHGDDYGAIREVTPYTPWCYTRDALSVAWSFIELYRYTNEKEYLQRAVLWGDWFLKKGCDEDGWPYWGHYFEPLFDAVQPWPQMSNDIQGSFQGGSLNFLYQMYLTTGDKKWIGKPFFKIADHFIKYNQRESGFFGHVLRETKEPPASDPQGGLHRANDDLGTLGLLCAYRISKKEKYLDAIKKYLKAVFDGQLKGGKFEESVACIPVVMNILLESKRNLKDFTVSQKAIDKALSALFNSQSDGRFYGRMYGGILENGPEQKERILAKDSAYVCTRSSCYTLIVLPKLVKGSGDYLTSF